MFDDYFANPTMYATDINAEVSGCFCTSMSGFLQQLQTLHHRKIDRVHIGADMG